MQVTAARCEALSPVSNAESIFPQFPLLANSSRVGELCTMRYTTRRDSQERVTRRDLRPMELIREETYVAYSYSDEPSRRRCT